MSTFTFTTLDDPSGTHGTSLFRINNLGQIVGVYFDSSNVLQGFLYSNGTYTTLNDPLGVNGTQATGINNLGQIVGAYYDSGNVLHGFLYSNGTYTTLNDPLASSASTPQPNPLLLVGTVANGINNLGQIVGTYYDSNGLTHGFLYSNGTYTTLDDPLAVSVSQVVSRFSGTQATGINNLGQIVGVYFDSSNVSHGFLYSNGTYTTITDPLVGSSFPYGTTVSGINDAGQIVGQYEDSSGYTHGFIASLPLTIYAVTDTGGTYLNAGHLVTITVTTSLVDTVTGTPTLQLNDGEVAGYTGGSGTNTLTFTYAVQTGDPGDNTADLQVTGLNLPTGSSIVDSNGKSLSTTIAADLGIQIDTTTVPPTSVQQEIFGLYAALYGRATDSGGVAYWDGQVSLQPDGSGVTIANAATTAVTANDAAVLGQAFVNTQSTYFNSVYGSLTDSAFINALYVNIGGNAGDPNGIAYWAAILAQNEAGGQSVQAARAGLVGQFVQDVVEYNLAAGAAGLTPAQLLAATQRQAAVDNKIAVSEALSIASQQPGGAILDVHAVGDAAFNAAATVIASVTYDPATVTAAILGINNAVAAQNLALI